MVVVAAGFSLALSLTVRFSMYRSSAVLASMKTKRYSDNKVLYTQYTPQSELPYTLKMNILSAYFGVWAAECATV